MALRKITPRDKHAVVDLIPEGTLVTAMVTAVVSDTLEIGPYPQGSLHVVIRNGASVAYRVQESNVDGGAADACWVDSPDTAADQSATKLVRLNQSTRLVRVKFTGGSAGTVHAVYNGSLQS